ncbi:Uncharacterised protein at_DN0313 [Pycnogonum litorale]
MGTCGSFPPKQGYQEGTLHYSHCLGNLCKIGGSTVFSTLDAVSGFMQVKLDEQSSRCVTFATPFGRYHFLRLPYDIASAPEVFHRTIVEHFSDIPGVEVYVDDLLVHGANKEEHDSRLRTVLARCRTINLKLNKDKCFFERSELRYLGHIIGQDQVKIDPAKVKAIVDMRLPGNKDDLARFLGMITYVAKVCPNLSNVAAPLRELTKKNAAWHWGEFHNQAWANLKDLISDAPSLRMFDPRTPVRLSILQQDQPVEYASCSLTPAQERYSQIEEFLAVQFGLTRFHQYVYGQSVTVETDQKPLLGIVKKGLNDLSPRLLRMRLRNHFRIAKRT